MKLTDAFDLVMVINLPHRTDRQREVRAELARIGSPVDDRKVRIFAAVRPADSRGFSSIGARGCFLSHLGALKEAARSGARSVLLLEDDVDFSTDFTTRWPAIAKQLAIHDWDVFYGAWLQLDQPLTGRGLLVLPPAVSVMGAHMVAIRGPAINEALTYLNAMLTRPAGDPQGGPMHVDGAYGWYRAAHPERVTLFQSVPLAHQRSSRTDIHALRWFDRWAGVRSLAQLARRTRARWLQR